MGRGIFKVQDLVIINMILWELIFDGNWNI